MSSQKETKAYDALSHISRIEILKSLQKGKPLSIEEIAKEVGIEAITVRHHLKSLEQAGFVDSYQERKGSAGRPKFYYVIAKEPTVVGYPKRRYLTFSHFMIKTLQLAIGTNRAGKILKRVGRNMGESVIKELESRHDINEWSMQHFTDFFIKGYLEDTGADPEIVATEKKAVTYRLYNCPFLELAVKMPETMCDVFHDSFDEGICKTMGGKARIIRITCKAEGDAYCEHKCEWETTPT